MDKLVKISYAIYYGVLAYAFYHNFVMGDWTAFYLCFLALVTPFCVPIVFKILKLKMIPEISLFNIWFVFFASLVGSCLGGYATKYYDKITHFMSGVLMIEVAYLLYSLILKKCHPENKEEQNLMYIFLFCVNATIALLWEFYEYACLVIANYDCIKHYPTGVHDSLTDMIAGTLGGVVVLGFIIHYYKTHKMNFFVSLHNHFIEENSH